MHAWYDKYRVNSLVGKGYIGTNDGRLYLTREVKA